MDFNLNSTIHIASMISVTFLILFVTKIIYIFIDIKTDRSRLINAVALILFFLFLQFIDAFVHMPWFDSYEYTRALSAIVPFLASMVFVNLLDYFVWNGIAKRNGKPGVPKILTNILKVVIYFVTLVAIANKVYNMPIATLLAATGLVTFILGYASQQTLSNFFAGIAIQFGGKLKKGQYIKAGDKEGVIIEFNWRSVTLKKGSLFIIPNTSMAHDVVTVLASDITQPYRWRSTLNINSHVDVLKVVEIGKEVVSDVSRQSAPPTFKMVGISGKVAVMWIEIEVASFAQSFEVKEIFYSSFFSKCVKNNLAPAFLRRPDLGCLAVPCKPTAQEVSSTLKSVEALKDLDDASMESIQEIGSLEYFGKGEHIIRQYGEGDSMFFIIEGEVQTMELHNKQKKVMRSLGQSAVFGLKAFLLGEPRRISVEVTSLSAWVLEIKRESFKSIMDAYPSILPDLTAVLVEREESNAKQHAVINEKERSHESIADIISSKIKELFKPKKVN